VLAFSSEVVVQMLAFEVSMPSELTPHNFWLPLISLIVKIEWILVRHRPNWAFIVLYEWSRNEVMSNHSIPQSNHTVAPYKPSPELINQLIKFYRSALLSAHTPSRNFEERLDHAITPNQQKIDGRLVTGLILICPKFADFRKFDPFREMPYGLLPRWVWAGDYPPRNIPHLTNST
jgi:hypothetical protein